MASVGRKTISVEPIVAMARRLVDNIELVIVGKEAAIELMVVALLCEGHILVEDVPGIGKTTLAKATARSIGCSFKRIQFTPDLLPSDVTGLYFFNQKTSQFEFRPGPIMANIVLADEINRATPRTQSCLLECMQERQVTLDVDTKPLPRPFMVIATQNPIELEGTFPLPEAQLDRFLLRITLGYPSREEENSILVRYERANPLDDLQAVVKTEELLALQKLSRQVYIEESTRGYITDITQATRKHQHIGLGASPRATMGLYSACQALAAVRGRDYVVPDDVKELAPSVLGHRLIIKAEARLHGYSREDVIAEVIGSVPVPLE